MPYQPGNQNISGQLLAQGINQGVGGAVDGWKEYQMNKAKNAAAQGVISGYLQSNPELMQGADEDILKKLEKFKGGNTGLKDNLMLAGWAATTQKGWEQKQEMQARQMQMQQAKMQMDAMQRQQAQQAAAQRFIGQAAQAQGGATGPLSNAAFKEQTSPMAVDAVALNKFSGELPSQSILAELQSKRGLSNSKPTPLVFATEEEMMKRYPTERFEYAFTTLPDGRVAIPDGKISGRASVPSNMPPGFEMDPATPGGIRPIKGSEGDMKRQESELAKVRAFQAEAARADVVLTAIRNVIPRIDAITSGFVGNFAKVVPGTEPHDVAQIVDTIKANIGFEELQKMRQASPTGGALGQVAVKELEFLQASLGNLSVSQSPKQLVKTLKEVETHFTRWKRAASGDDPEEPTLEEIKAKYRAR